MKTLTGIFWALSFLLATSNTNILENLKKDGISGEAREVVMLLRLQKYQPDLARIYFYDDNNETISFDTTGIRFECEPVYGIYYEVKFKFKGVGNDRVLYGELLSFQVKLLDKLP